MQRVISFFFSAIAVTFLFTATAASAETVYRVTLSEATSDRIHVIRRAPWRCNDASCATNQARSGAANTCHSVARELGTLVNFSVDGELFTEEQLAECNEAAS
jgi:hypothetical protein